ncbi:MAG: nucleoside monophosphate kinase, partial [Clostridia bacterium]
MIITVTGKPCSGKGTACKLIAKNKNFEYISTGDMFRELSQQSGQDILNFQKNDNIKDIDKLIDDKIADIGKTRLNDNIIIDSRLAWHFIPDSFKVFIDVDLDTASQRLMSSNRNTEQTTSLNESMRLLTERWNLENSRYLELYGINNLNLNNYDFVISSN